MSVPVRRASAQGPHPARRGPRNMDLGPWPRSSPGRKVVVSGPEMVVTMAEDRIHELQTEIGKLRAQQAEDRKQLIKTQIEHWQGRIDDLEVRSEEHTSELQSR